MPPTPVRILQIESDYFYKIILEHLIRRRGGYVQTFIRNRLVDIDEALGADYDVCILNLAQPYSAGIDHAMKIHECKPDLPQIFWTGAKRHDFETWAAKLSYEVAYVPKDSTQFAILDKVDEVLADSGWWEPGME